MKARWGVSVLALAAAAFAGGWHYGLFEIPTSHSTNAAPVANSAPSVAANTPVATPVAKAPAPSQPNTPAAQTATSEASATPSFDVVRVEPDGAAVVAGRAAPNSTVSLQSGSERLAEAKTDATGAFALDLTLPVGQHRLALSGTAEPADPERMETAIVNVPQKGHEGELLVMVERPGEASEIIVKPEAQGPSAQPQEPSAAAASSQTPPADAPQTAASNTAPAAGETKASVAALSVEAVEAEGGKLFIAGAARERAKVHIYLDDAFVAETIGGAGDRFIASADAPVSVGDHVVRADELDAAGQVVGRVEVPFNRPDASPLAAIAPADTQPATAPGAGSAQEAGSPATTADAQDRTLQPALERVDARVIIRKGDTLWRISRNTYGRGSRFTVIYLANGDQIRNPNRIYPGQVFRVPDTDG